MKAVNLLPPELRSGPRRGGSASTSAAPAPGGVGPFLVLGALALCVLAAVAYVLTANTVTERRTELARVSAELEATASTAAALKPYGDYQELAVRRRQTVTSLAALRFDWEQVLRDISHALPGAVTLSSLDGSIATNAGGSATPLRGEISAPAITLKGCTTSQPAVATMLSRLRGVRGVTRVTLAKSERPAAPASTGTGVGPCGRGTPPQFEVVIFFERSDAGAAVPVAGATPPAGAAETPTPTADAPPAADAGQPAPAAGAPTP